MAAGEPFQRLRIRIKPQLLKGPFSIQHTMLSGQTSQPEWSPIDSGFWTVETLDDQPARIELRQFGDAASPDLALDLVSNNISDRLIAQAKDYVRHVFRFDDDLNRFYSLFDGDLLSTAFSEFKGLRLMGALNPFEALISSICSQNNSVRNWNNTAQKLKTLYGHRLYLPDGTVFYQFPTPETLAKAKVRDIKQVTRAGYRSQYIVKISRMITRGGLDLLQTAKMKYPEAKQEIMKGPGIGPKVADCFLLYGLGFLEAAPVDVWVHRGVRQLYRRKRITRPAAGDLLRQRYDGWAGYAQLYLFHWIRTRNAASN